MEEYLPSEIARLVLGYINESKCSEAWMVFLTECTDLQEYYRLYQAGKVCSTNIDGKSLTEILHEYRRLKYEAVLRNSERQSCSSEANSSVPPFNNFKTPRKSNGNSYLRFRVDQKTKSQSTIKNLQCGLSAQKSPTMRKNINLTPSRPFDPRTPRRSQGIHVTSLNFGAETEDNARETPEKTIMNRMSTGSLTTPRQCILVTQSLRASTPSQRLCQSEPVNRKVQFNHQMVQTEDNSKVQTHSDASITSHNFQKIPSDKNSNNSVCEMNSTTSILNKSIMFRSSEVRTGEDVTLVTTIASSLTPQYSSDPPQYARAPNTNSPRLILSHDRSQVSSLTTPMKDKTKWTDDFASPKRKGFIPRRRLLKESPVPRQITSSEYPLACISEDWGSIFEEVSPHQPFVQKFTDNINKVMYNDEHTKVAEGSNSTGYLSLQDIHGSDEIIKNVFDEFLSLLSSTRDVDEANITQKTTVENVDTPNTSFSTSILAETPHTNSPDISLPFSPANQEVTTEKNSNNTRDESCSVTNDMQNKKTGTNFTPHQRDTETRVVENQTETATKSISDSALNPELITDTGAKAPKLQKLQAKGDTPSESRSVDVLDSCVSLIQSDSQEDGDIVEIVSTEQKSPEKNNPESVPVSKAENSLELDDKTIKQVSIGTPFQVETQIATTQSGCSPIKNTIKKTPIKTIQSTTQNTPKRNASILPTMHPTPTILQLPYTAMPTFYMPVPTVASAEGFQYRIFVNPGVSWGCSNVSSDVVLPVHTAPARIAQNHTNMPVVQLSPIKIPHDYSPTKAICGENAQQLNNLGSFTTVPTVKSNDKKKRLRERKRRRIGGVKSPETVVSSSTVKTKNRKRPPKKKSPLLSSIGNKVSNDDKNMDDIPVLSIPESSPCRSDSMSAMELLSNITENKNASVQSPLLKAMISSAKLLVGKNDRLDSHYVRNLDFTPPGPKETSIKSLVPPLSNINSCAERRSPRLKNKTACKSPCCSPERKEPNKSASKEESQKCRAKSNAEKSKARKKLTPDLIEATIEQVSLQKPVTSVMTDAVLSAMENALHDKSPENFLNVNNTLDQTVNTTEIPSIDLVSSPDKESPTKTITSADCILPRDEYFPCSLTESDSDSNILPLASLLTPKQKLALSSSPMVLLKRLSDSESEIEIITPTPSKHHNVINNNKKILGMQTVRSRFPRAKPNIPPNSRTRQISEKCLENAVSDSTNKDNTKTVSCSAGNLSNKLKENNNSDITKPFSQSLHEKSIPSKNPFEESSSKKDLLAKSESQLKSPERLKTSTIKNNESSSVDLTDQKEIKVNSSSSKNKKKKRDRAKKRSQPKPVCLSANSKKGTKCKSAEEKNSLLAKKKCKEKVLNTVNKSEISKDLKKGSDSIKVSITSSNCIETAAEVSTEIQQRNTKKSPNQSKLSVIQSPSKFNTSGHRKRIGKLLSPKTLLSRSSPIKNNSKISFTVLEPENSALDEHIKVKPPNNSISQFAVSQSKPIFKEGQSNWSKKVLPPPKKRIRPVPVTSPNEGSYSPFSPFSSPDYIPFTTPNPAEKVSNTSTEFKKASPVYILPVSIVANEENISTLETGIELSSTSPVEAVPNSIDGSNSDIKVTKSPSDIASSICNSKIIEPVPSQIDKPALDVTTTSNNSLACLENDAVSTSTYLVNKSLERKKIAMRCLSGKPKAMAEFYKTILPNRNKELPISPDTISSSSCTIDGFLAKKKLVLDSPQKVTTDVTSTPNSAEKNKRPRKKSPTRKLSSANLKYLFLNDSNLISPVKYAPYTDDPAPSTSALFAFHLNNSQDGNSVVSPIKSCDKDNTPSSQTPLKNSQLSVDQPIVTSENSLFIKDDPQLTSIVDADSSDEEGLIKSPITDIVPEQQSSKEELKTVVEEATLNKKLDSSVKVLCTNDRMITTSVNSTGKGESVEKGLFISQIKTPDTASDGSSKNKRKHSSTKELLGPCLKVQKLDSKNFSGRQNQYSPVRNVVPSKKTKPKSVLRKRTEQDPNIPAGVKLPSKWNNCKISNYSSAIKNGSSKDYIKRDDRDFTKSHQRRSRPSLKIASFKSPHKEGRVLTRKHWLDRKSHHSKSSKRSSSHHSRNYDQNLGSRKHHSPSKSKARYSDHHDTSKNYPIKDNYAYKYNEKTFPKDSSTRTYLVNSSLHLDGITVHDNQDQKHHKTKVSPSSKNSQNNMELETTEHTKILNCKHTSQDLEKKKRLEEHVSRLCYKTVDCDKELQLPSNKLMDKQKEIPNQDKADGYLGNRDTNAFSVKEKPKCSNNEENNLEEKSPSETSLIGLSQNNDINESTKTDSNEKQEMEDVDRTPADEKELKEAVAFLTNDSDNSQEQNNASPESLPSSSTLASSSVETATKASSSEHVNEQHTAKEVTPSKAELLMNKFEKYGLDNILEFLRRKQ